MEFTNNIKYVRRCCGKTQQECADFLGVTRKGFAWYEKSDRIYYDIVLNLAELLDVSPDILMIRGK
jgi:transcriptional regulator with XRE-family HTH domain